MRPPAAGSVGPMGLANREIRIARDQFVAGRLTQWRVASLIRRSDRLPTEFEKLNVARVRVVPARLVLELRGLIGDAPMLRRLVVAERLSPRMAVDHIFDLQEALLASRSGVTHQEDSEEWERAS